MNTYALILCGGSGTRMGIKQNKTLLPVGGVPAVVKCVRAFRPLVAGIVLVVRAGDENAFRAALEAAGEAVPLIVPGGDDRQASALCGLNALPGDAEAVLIHDGARPFVSREVIRNVLGSVLSHGTGVAAVPARDTIKRAAPDGLVLETPDRATLYQVQTPQGFRVSDLRAAHRAAQKRYTDDAALMEAAGFPVRLVPGSYENIKLTSPEDLKMTGMTALPRVGHGYDAHRLAAGRALVLCGESIPYEKGLLGHSDADVALHALMDAMLGAAALGDIGQWFPDSDERYRGISSVLLLRKVAALLGERGYQVGNVDVTILAQAPKIAPYIPKMRLNVASALGLAPEQVSVKATTTEKMGFEGRGEGISAHAVAILCLT